MHAGGQVSQDWAAAAQPHVVAEYEDEADHCGHPHPHCVSMPVQCAIPRLLAASCSPVAACQALHMPMSARCACLLNHHPACLLALSNACSDCVPCTCLSAPLRSALLCCPAFSLSMCASIFALPHCLQSDHLLRRVLLWRQLLQVMSLGLPLGSRRAGTITRLHDSLASASRPSPHR